MTQQPNDNQPKVYVYDIQTDDADAAIQALLDLLGDSAVVIDVDVDGDARQNGK